MVLRVRPSLKASMLDLTRIFAGISRTEIADMLGVSYWKARYWLEVLAEEGEIRKEVVWWIVPYMRRVRYYPVTILPPEVMYYRTQYAIMFYTEKPRTKTPDPIAEFRVTVVSDKPDSFDIGYFNRVCIYIGVVLSPQTYWYVQLQTVTAYEKDELIDTDELGYSVPVHKRLNYAERYAVFYTSKKGRNMWRHTHGEWWRDESIPIPNPQRGDYEYDEEFIKAQESRLIGLGVLKYKFNNKTGRMESVEV